MSPFGKFEGEDGSIMSSQEVRDDIGQLYQVVNPTAGIGYSLTMEV